MKNDKIKKNIKTTLKEFLNENNQVKSTKSSHMFELLKTLPFVKYVNSPSGRFLHSIDLIIVDENNIDDLKEILDKNNWYIERGRNRSFTITQKYIEDAKVEIPNVLYHITPTKNVESILKHGLKPKSEDLRHRYPPRIYVADNIKTLKYLEKELKRWKGGDEDYSIIKIDTTGLNIDLYIDTTSAYKGHYYIQDIDKIPIENLELLNNLTDVILSVRDEFNCSYEEINQGKCVDFVDEVMDRFSGNFETFTTSMFVIDDDKKKEYLISTYNDRILKHGDIEWSKNMLDEYGYPNKQLMDSEPPKHIWIYYNGKHYDAEEPKGVNNPWDLPIFDKDNWF